MKRTFLFLVTNFAVMIVLSLVVQIVCSILGVRASSSDLMGLAVSSLIYGMAGGVISLLLSKTMAKFQTKAKTITGEEGEAERWLIDTVQALANKANIKMPEVAIYPGEPNAFATGAFKNHALVAVSTGIMKSMTREELRAVLGHEMSHVANGDMVTMTLVQGVLNACVIFLARIISAILGGALRDRNGRSNIGSSFASHATYMLLQSVLGVGASIITMWFSRHREYAADAGSADLLGSPTSMINALRRLGNLQPGVLPGSLAAFGAVGLPKLSASLFATHPSLEDRIAALEKIQQGL